MTAATKGATPRTKRRELLITDLIVQLKSIAEIDLGMRGHKTSAQCVLDAADLINDLERALSASIARLSRTKAELEAARRDAQWVKEELADGDKICNALGLERTEGGRLPMYKILSRLKNVQDAE